MIHPLRLLNGQSHDTFSHMTTWRWLAKCLFLAKIEIIAKIKIRSILAHLHSPCPVQSWWRRLSPSLSTLGNSWVGSKPNLLPIASLHYPFPPFRLFSFLPWKYSTHLQWQFLFLVVLRQCNFQKGKSSRTGFLSDRKRFYQMSSLKMNGPKV